jgi:AraC-like DNA-binding protein
MRPPPGRAGPLRAVVHTRDQDAAIDMMNRLVPHHPQIRITRRGEVDFLVRSTELAGWGADQVRIAGVRYSATVPPTPFLLAGVMIDGRGRFGANGRDVVLGSGDGLLYPVGASYSVDFSDAFLSYVRMPQSLVADLAEQFAGLAPGELRFVGSTPVSERMNEMWAATTLYLVEQLNRPGLDLPPLLAYEMMRTAAGALLRAFPNTTMTVAHVPGAGQAAPAVVRRAIAYLEENAERSVSTAEAAAAAGVGARALQAAFRRHLDTTPLAYLRGVRLDRARRDLRFAQPGEGVTIAEVARRWGFAKPSRFSAEYRAAFGELPSQTLRG